MGVGSGLPGAPDVHVTREVRWFANGPLPPKVASWFAGQSSKIEHEDRRDQYDLDAVRRGVGLKKRHAGSIDSKHRLHSEREVTLAPGLAGRVEDWVKISRPTENDPAEFNGEQIEVAKKIMTRKFLLAGEAGSVEPVGCEVELAAISVDGVEAWSLCFETFGDPALRREALASGVQQLLAETPLPSGMTLDPKNSFGYPEWLRRLPIAAV